MGRISSHALGFCNAYSEKTTPTGLVPTMLSMLSVPTSCIRLPFLSVIRISVLLRLRMICLGMWSRKRIPSFDIPVQMTFFAWL